MRARASRASASWKVRALEDTMERTSRWADEERAALVRELSVVAVSESSSPAEAIGRLNIMIGNVDRAAKAAAFEAVQEEARLRVTPERYSPRPLNANFSYSEPDDGRAVRGA